MEKIFDFVGMERKTIEKKSALFIKKSAPEGNAYAKRISNMKC
jgi:hypothetical protein